jgi:putative salt-induced outer membrane protein YdiY
MRNARSFGASVLAGILTFAAPALADQIVMKNGDRVSGVIVKKDAKTLTIKSEFFGVVTLPWDQVESVKADTPITVELSNKETVQGTLATAGDKVEVVSGAGRKQVAPSEIVALRDRHEQHTYERLLHPGWDDLWVGTANLGWAGTLGNAKTSTWTTSFNTIRQTRHDKTTLYFNSIVATALVDRVNAKTAQAVRGGWAHNRNITSRMFVNVFNDWEYDRFQNLDLRAVIGAGIGVNLWKAERGVLDLVGGIAYNREKFDPVRPDLPFVRNGADAYWGDDFNFKLNSRISYFQNYRMFNNLSEHNRWRVNFDTGATTHVTKWLTWSVSLSDRYLNLPVVGRKRNDFLYTTGFGIKFAR